MASSTCEISTEVNSRLQNIARIERIPKNTLIGLAASSLVCRYRELDRFILVDLKAPPKTSHSEKARFTLYLSDNVESLLNKMVVDLEYYTKNHLIEMAAHALVTNYESTGIHIFFDLLNPAHKEKKPSKSK